MSDFEPHTLAGGRYLLVEPIGEGGMATVYRSFDQRLQVWRAIKVLNPKYARSRRVRERFDAEAQTMALLEHPNIVRVYDVGSIGEISYIVMELVQGGALVDWLERYGAMPPGLALSVTDQICHGISAAHRKGVIHRDVKPHNVLVTLEGVCRITDFGIARVGSGDLSKTKTGAVMGTWGYMAPEQRSDAKTVDERADVYALAATLFTLLTNRIPMDLFAADRDQSMLAGVPPDLFGVLTTATEYHREARYESVEAFRLALVDVGSRLPADPEGTPHIVSRRPSDPAPPSDELVARAGPLIEADARTTDNPTLMPSSTTDPSVGRATPISAFRISDGEGGATPDPAPSTAGRARWVAPLALLFVGFLLLSVAGALALPLVFPAVTPDAPPVDEPSTPTVDAGDGVADSAVDTQGADDTDTSVAPPPSPEPTDDTPSRPVPSAPPSDPAPTTEPQPDPADEDPPEPANEPSVDPVSDSPVDDDGSTDASTDTSPAPVVVERDPSQCIRADPSPGIVIGSRAPFKARLCNEDGSPVTLWYRPAGGSNWQSVGMPYALGAHRAVIKVDERFSSGLDYFIQTDGATYGTREDPHRVGVR